MAKVKHLSFSEGESWIVTFALRDAGGQPLNLTGALVEWAVSPTVAAGASLLVSSAGVYVTITDAVAGLGEVAIPPEGHSGVPDGEYTHELRATLADTTVTVQITGNLTVGASAFSAGGAESFGVVRSGHLQLDFDSGTTDADPGDGEFRFNNATASLASFVYVDLLDRFDVDITDWLAALDDSTTTAARGHLRFTKALNGAVWHEYLITGAVVTATGYRKVPVSHVDGGGSFAAGDIVLVQFSRTGNTGATGATGPAGTNGTNGLSGASALTVVDVVATANVDIATALENGDTVDGVVLATNDLVLLTGQTAPAENGVYVVPASGAAARHASFDAYDELPGAHFAVMEGTAKADTLWVCTSNKGGTIGTTAVAISERLGAGAGDMLKATYDPTNIAASPFARANHTGTQTLATISDAGAAAAAGVKNSVEIDAAAIHLVGDALTPGNSKFYGTSAAGAKGWNNLDLDKLTDVDLVTEVPAANDILRFNGTSWVPEPPPDGTAPIGLGDMTDVDFTTAVPVNGDMLQYDGVAEKWEPVAYKESLVIAASDETTALTAGTGKVTFRMPYAFTLTAVRASLTTAQATNGAGGIFTVDLNEAGVSVLSTKLTIDNTEKTSTTAVTAAVISDAALADDAEMSVDIDQIGDGTAKGLKVVFIGRRT